MSELGYKNEDIFPQKISINNFIDENLAEEKLPNGKNWNLYKRLFGYTTLFNMGMLWMIG